MSLAYDTRNKYYDIDAMYAAMEVNNILIKNNEIADYSSRNYVDLLYNQENLDVEEFQHFYDNTGFLLKNAYYVKSDNVIMEQLNELNNYNQYLKDYTSYLDDKIEFDNYNYLILVEIQKNDTDDVYFYTLKVGDTNEP